MKELDIKWLQEYAEQEKRYKWGEQIKLLLTAYEKEKETSHYIQSQLDIANAKLVEEKEIMKNAICFLKYYNKDFNKMSDNEIKQILYGFGKCADIKKEE